MFVKLVHGSKFRTQLTWLPDLWVRVMPLCTQHASLLTVPGVLKARILPIPGDTTKKMKFLKQASRIIVVHSPPEHRAYQSVRAHLAQDMLDRTRSIRTASEINYATRVCIQQVHPARSTRPYIDIVLCAVSYSDVSSNKHATTTS